MSLLGEIKRIFRGNKAIVLMYHRIADTAIDPWRLAVSKKNFEDHIAIIEETGCAASVSTLVNGLENHTIDRDMICITFDDGYRDNYLYALPVLEKYHCNAMFFIPSGSINSNEPFWWDTLADIFLSTEKLPSHLSLIVADKIFEHTLDNDGELSNAEHQLHMKWYWPTDPPTQRCRIYLEIWMHLRDLPQETIVAAVNALKAWSGFAPKDISGNFPMTNDELIKLSQSKCAEIGVHTVNHAALGSLSVEEQKKELTGCMHSLEAITNKSYQRIVAYPYGSCNADTMAVAREAGLKAGFTTDPKIIHNKSDLFHLGRYQVMNENAEQFKRTLNQLMND